MTGSVTQVISVVTAVGRVDPQHLTEAYESLCAQVLPAGWSWEWAVQSDGPHHDELPLPAAARQDPRVRPGSQPHGGPAVARTTALARCHGPLVRVLDADDQLPETALADAITALSTDPGIGWTASAVLDLVPDGTLTGWDGDPAEGVLPQGSTIAAWMTDPAALRIHPATLTVRRALLVAVGGWSALPVSEDMGMLAGLDSLASGYFLARPGLVRRSHPGQMTRTPEFAGQVAALRGFIAERATVLRGLFPSAEEDAAQARQLLGRRLRDLRRASNLTGRDLAHEAGWHPSKVTRTEQGGRMPTPDDLRTWCAITGAQLHLQDLLAAVRNVDAVAVEARRARARQRTIGASPDRSSPRNDD
ncbi:helix-turn-helix domain-containing protein [Nocardia farcinica]|uniref:helix-turn-helix domain-containing protein n=1 Tax=Nocardia farcinica TaxID=37329 RepID=UPI00076100FB|nr:helix-turn-helix domain-containing protein [Nocardia farcinica]AXK89979.1 glycosyltransferase [Nocardia farcinica]